MFKRILFVVLLMLFVVGVSAVMADEGDLVPVPVEDEDNMFVMGFGDGRLNAFDISAPVAVFSVYDHVIAREQGVPVWNTDGTLKYEDVFKGIELWSYNGATGASQLAMFASAEQLNALIAEDGGVLQEGAFNLIYTPTGLTSGEFTVLCPDRGGLQYQFTWDA